MSKAFTMAARGMLCNDGRLSPDDTVGKLSGTLPKGSDERWLDVTVADCLRMRLFSSLRLQGLRAVRGHTYSDSCGMSVKIPVESIDISQRRLTLKVCEIADITAEVSPGKVTVQTFKRYDSDAKIATVTVDGKITEVGEGDVKVFAVTDDGNYKATCKVDVTK